MTLTIFTNHGNPVTLKPILVANILEVDVKVDYVTVLVDGKQRPRLPLMVIDECTRIFDTNAMVTYLLEMAKAKESSVAFLNFLNFETHSLFPLVLSYLAEKGDAEYGAGKELLGVLHSLRATLGSQKYFSRTGKPGVEDAVTWATLYPLFAAGDEKLLRSIGELKVWFERTKECPPFAAALKQILPLHGKEASKVILVCNPTAVTSLFGETFSKLHVTDSAMSSTIEKNDDEISLEELKAAKVQWNKPLPSSSVKAKGVGQILPVTGQKNYLITSALPYVNNVPHLGNIIGCVLSADVFARYCRIRGRNSLYICGTDEYGTATETKALEEKLTPQQICDKYHKLHKEIYDWFDISFDYFGRTTTKEQTTVGQEIFLKLNGNGYLKEMTVQQLFCVPCARFLSDRFVEGTCPSCAYDDARGDQCDKCGRLTNSTELKNPRCKVCSSRDVITKNSEQVFLDLPKLEAEVGLADWLDKASEGWTSNARLIAKSWIREGLKERCITRDLKWGTPVPIEKYKDKVFYVWFDAPIGYISMTACYTSNWRAWWMNTNPDVDIEYFQFMAKDNVPFHSILFPASLKGTGDSWTLVRHLMATEYLNYEEGKFSKSRGVGVFGNDAINTGIPADIWRFYLIWVRPENQDSAFSWDDFMTKNNNELLNNLGNFVNRSLSFLVKFFESKIPAMKMSNEDFRIVAEVNKEIAEYVNLLEMTKLRDGLRHILAISKIGNVYFQSQQPWTLNKNEADRERCGTICGLGAQMVFLIMTLVEPFMPGVSRQLREQLNVPKPIFSTSLMPFLPPGHEIGNITPLFQKMEQPFMDTLRSKYAGPQVIEGKSPTKVKPGAGNKVVLDVNATVTTGAVTPEEIAHLELEIAKQGALVRDLKAAKTEISVLKPQIEKLLQLKKELTLKQGPIPDPAEIAQLEGEITKQGAIVRDLKAAKTEISVLKPQIEKLLQLKKELSLKQGPIPSPNSGNNNSSVPPINTKPTKVKGGKKK